MNEGWGLSRVERKKREAKERRKQCLLLLCVAIFIILGSVLAFASDKTKEVISQEMAKDRSEQKLDKPENIESEETIEVEPKASVIEVQSEATQGVVEKEDGEDKIYGITKEEVSLFERLVQAEAGGETLHGKLAVATVVMNRVDNGHFPNSITEVILQKKQFTPVSNGKIQNTPSEDSKKAVQEVLEGYRSFSGEVLFFCNPSIASNTWMIDEKEHVMTIGNHQFYK